MVGRCRDTQELTLTFPLLCHYKARIIFFLFILFSITIFIAEATIWHLNNKMKGKEQNSLCPREKNYGISNKEGVFPETPFCI